MFLEKLVFISNSPSLPLLCEDWRAVSKFRRSGRQRTERSSYTTLRRSWPSPAASKLCRWTFRERRHDRNGTSSRAEAFLWRKRDAWTWARAATSADLPAGSEVRSAWTSRRQTGFLLRTSSAEFLDEEGSGNRAQLSRTASFLQKGPRRTAFWRSDRGIATSCKFAATTTS